jgi:hypothetical protein
MVNGQERRALRAALDSVDLMLGGRTSLIAVVVAAALCLAPFRGEAAMADTPPADLVPSQSPPSTVGPVLSFKLPYLEHRIHDPNAQDVAQHAAGHAPLLIFLPATGEVPSQYREFLATAVSVGYSVLGLDYWNTGMSVTRTCRGDPRCYTQLQQNRLSGSDASRFSRVGTANSILHRFGAAIEYLQTLDPQGDWGRYLLDGHPVWKNVVFAGHSQGGGESAYIGHLHKLQGVLMFSSPVETFGDVSASWMDTRGATPPSRMYGFDDVHDIYFTRITGSWRRLHMGDPDPQRASAVPTGSHVMLSSLDIGGPLHSHGRSVDDGGPRTEKGTMTFAPTWAWMLEQVR